MSKRDKLIATLMGNPNDCRFSNACKIAEWLDFKYKGGKGSHRVYARAGERETLNFQNRNVRITAYQARQLIAMIEKYGSND